MAGRIKQEDVEAVRERTDIVKLVSQYLTLKKAGGDNMTGLCPFHQEKTPSFSVSPGKQLFFCHGCGKGGDAIAFLRELEHLGFAEAVERLAQQAGVTLRYEGDSPAERRAAARRMALIKANEEAARLFTRCWPTGARPRRRATYVADARHLRRRRWSGSASATHRRYPDFLLKRMTREFSPEILLEAGLATRGDEGSTIRDRFRGRVTFPIHDLQGRGIGFGARILPTDPRASEQAKYLNTAETPIYKKNEVLFNLAGARTAIARSGEVYVVEGYTDVIGLVAGRHRERGGHVRHGVGGGALPVAQPVRAARDPGVRLGRGRRACGRARVRVPGDVSGAGRRDDHAAGVGSGGLRREARRRRRARRPRRGRGRSSSTWCGGRSRATTCPPWRDSPPRWPTRFPSWKGCRIRYVAASTGTCWRTWRASRNRR